MKRHEIIRQILVRLGGPGSGHHGHKGRPGQRGGSSPGSTLVSKPGGHLWERARQRTGFKVVREAIKKLTSNPVLPASEDQAWHMPLLAGERVKGYLVGNDAYATTVLGPWGRPRENSMEIKLTEHNNKPLDAKKSIRALWATMSEDDRKIWESLNGLHADEIDIDEVDPLDMLASIVEVLSAKEP